MVMRVLCASFLIFVVLTAASAADLKVKVIDPQSAAVSGAQVSLFSKGANTPLKIAASSAEGIASFSDLKSADLSSGELSSGNYRIQVLAPGFAPHTEDITTYTDLITIQLHLATASE